jgi:hypothetical protein
METFLITVIAGLDPAIHLFRKKMDPRVKPAGDAQIPIDREAL